MTVHSFSSPLMLAVAEACRKRVEALAGNKSFMSLPGLPATLDRRPAASSVSSEASVTHWDPGRRNQPVINRLVAWVNA
jgi:hypothetical protein